MVSRRGTNHYEFVLIALRQWYIINLPLTGWWVVNLKDAGLGQYRVGVVEDHLSVPLSDLVFGTNSI